MTRLDDVSPGARNRGATAVARGMVSTVPGLARTWQVASLTNPQRSYRVRGTEDLEFISCECLHGWRAGGNARCYHVAAVLLTLEGEERW